MPTEPVRALCGVVIVPAGAEAAEAAEGRAGGSWLSRERRLPAQPALPALAIVDVVASAVPRGLADWRWWFTR